MSSFRFLATARRSATTARLQLQSQPQTCATTRSLHQSRTFAAAQPQTRQQQAAPPGTIDGLAAGSAKGRTGGGKPLDSSSKNAPPQPKISNQSVPGIAQKDALSEEQRREVDEHNRDFDAKHDHSNEAPDDKVDKKFWSGRRHARDGD